MGKPTGWLGRQTVLVRCDTKSVGSGSLKGVSVTPFLACATQSISTAGRALLWLSIERQLSSQAIIIFGGLEVVFEHYLSRITVRRSDDEQRSQGRLQVGMF